MAAGLMNHTKGARRIGETVIAPGMAAVIHDDSWAANPIVKEWVANNLLEVVPVGAVEGINSGMGVKKAIRAAEVAEQEADNAAGAQATAAAKASPPAGNTPPKA